MLRRFQIELSTNTFVHQWPTGQGARLAINGLRVQILAATLPSATLGKLFTHICLCYQAVQFGTDQWVVMLGGWGGNRRPGEK